MYILKEGSAGRVQALLELLLLMALFCKFRELTPFREEILPRRMVFSELVGFGFSAIKVNIVCGIISCSIWRIKGTQFGVLKVQKPFKIYAVGV